MRYKIEKFDTDDEYQRLMRYIEKDYLK